MEKIYGIHAISTLLQHNPNRIKQLWYNLDAENVRIAAIINQARSLGITIAPRPKKELQKMIDGVHQNIIAEVVAPRVLSESMLSEIIQTTATPLFLALDGVTDPHNLGACLRTAAAAGVNAVIITKDKSVSLNATVCKVACGAADLLPVIAVTNLARCLDNLQQLGMWIYGAAGESADTIYQHDLCCPLVLVMGAEGKGLRRLTREKCNVLVKIPMQQEMASLNVSVATGVCLFEIVRQRHLF